MEFVLIVIIVVIVSVISAAVKKKPQSSGNADAPVRPTMTDIQRAFMMAADEQPDAAPRPAQQAPPAAPYAPSQPYPSAVPYAQRQPSAAFAAPSVAASYAGLTDSAAVRPMAAESVSPYAGVQVSTYFMDDENQPQPGPKPIHPRSKTHAAAHIPLFEDQQDVVKAIIYAEILPRRSGAQTRFR